MERSDSPWYRVGRDEVCAQLGTDARAGLSQDEVARRREQYGPNTLTQSAGKPWWRILWAQINQPLVLILIAAGTITLLLNERVDSAVIFGVVVVNAAIGYVQEAKAVKAIEALAHELAGTATVLREDERHTVPSEDLVPGDIVLLSAGDRIPADVRLLRTSEFRVDESALTGESVPASKSVDALPGQVPLPDRRNMAYSATLVAAGAASGAVVATGDSSEIGRINTMIAGATEIATPLTRRMARFSQVLLWVILGLAAITIAVGLLRGEGLLDMFIAAVALAVGAIPEGLPAAMTITLAIGVHRMALRHAIIRRLPAVETLGSTTVICSDKTGTLTQNQMTVQHVWTPDGDFTVTGTGYDPSGEVLLDGRPLAVDELPATLLEALRAGLLCNDAQLVERDSAWHINGDPTEGALITAAAKAGLTAAAEEDLRPRRETLPFDSKYQSMATLHDGPNGRVAYIKGSVERVLAACADTWEGPDRSGGLSPEDVHRIAEEYAEEGLRVLALARLAVPPEQDELTHQDIASGLSFLGLAAMMDPPREQSAASVAACQEAGIHVKMITGDHRVTAAAIAEQIGLGDGSRVVEGAQLAKQDGEQLAVTAANSSVFARVSPEDKLRLVEALQGSGNIVAMTGDGVNDAPALKQADIGVAMGGSGTEVAKESADMVLTDDDFATITAAVEEGRGVFDNLIKFITWTLPTNVGEGLVIFVAVLAGVTLPITPVQILWINMTTAVLLGLTLAFEPKEPDIMRRPPRPPQAPVLSGELIRRIVLVGILLLIASFGLFQLQLSLGASLETARTVAANMFVIGETFYLFNCRSLRLPMWRLGWFSNPILIGGVALTLLLQLLFTYAQFMQVLFETAPLGLSEWLLIVAGGFAIYVITALEKWLHRRRTPIEEVPVGQA